MQQDAIEAFEHFLRTKNLKHSKPRSAIFDVFLTSQGHLSAQELYDQVKRQNPRVGFATVYRALKLLAERGLARGTTRSARWSRWQVQREYCGWRLPQGGPHLPSLPRKKNGISS